MFRLCITCLSIDSLNDKITADIFRTKGVGISSSIAIHIVSNMNEIKHAFLPLKLYKNLQHETCHTFLADKEQLQSPKNKHLDVHVVPN